MGILQLAFSVSRQQGLWRIAYYEHKMTVLIEIIGMNMNQSKILVD